MSSSDDEWTAIVMDTGSGMCKAGFAGDDAPRVVFPTIVGRPRFHDTIASCDQDTYVGDACQQKRAVLSLNHPIEHGIVTNWDDMEVIWQHIFENELRVSPNDHSVLLTESAMNPKQNKEKMTEVMIETFQVAGTYVALQGTLSVYYATGRGTAIVVNSGHGVTDVLTIYEGHAVPEAIKRIDLAGHDLTIYLSQLLRTSGYSFVTFDEMELVRCIKEKMCYTALDVENESAKMDSEKKQTYTLPDGQHIEVADERFRCTEAMFKPSLLGMDCRGMHEITYDSFLESPIDVRRDLYCNIVLSGGNTMFPGLQERLRNELVNLFPKTMRVKVVAPLERKCSVWIGGSILASMSTFQMYWITKEEYEEVGPNVVHKRCLTF